MIKISKLMLLRWAKGEIMYFCKGKGWAVNELECMAAEAALRRGETIQLTDGQGDVVSEMSLVNGEFVERSI